MVNEERQIIYNKRDSWDRWTKSRMFTFFLAGNSSFNDFYLMCFLSYIIMYEYLATWWNFSWNEKSLPNVISFHCWKFAFAENFNWFQERLVNTIEFNFKWKDTPEEESSYTVKLLKKILTEKADTGVARWYNTVINHSPFDRNICLQLG